MSAEHDVSAAAVGPKIVKLDACGYVTKAADTRWHQSAAGLGRIADRAQNRIMCHGRAILDSTCVDEAELAAALALMMWTHPNELGCRPSSSGLPPSGCLSSTVVQPVVCPAGAFLRSLRHGTCWRGSAKTARTTTQSKSCLNEAGCLDQRWPCMFCAAAESAEICPLLPSTGPCPS